MTIPLRYPGYISVIALFLTIVSAAQAKYSGGTGEPNDPYQIATAEDLITLGETPEDYNKHFILTTDIDLDPNLPGQKVFDRAVIAPDTDRDNQCAPFEGPSFAGVFDGGDHVISHLTVAVGRYLGLFGCLATNALVRGVGVVDVNITGSKDCVGCLVGMNLGAIAASYSTSSVGGTQPVGGLVGSNMESNCGRGGIMWACFWYIHASGLTTSDGDTGKTSTGMHTAKTFFVTGWWDFVDETANCTENIWWINEGQDYSMLWWELIPEN